jgi:hypothetical protein
MRSLARLIASRAGSSGAQLRACRSARAA